MEQKTLEKRCTLTDIELLERCNEWISSLAKTGGKSWTLNVPVNFNRDPDMLFSELANRYKALKDTPQLSIDVLEAAREKFMGAVNSILNPHFITTKHSDEIKQAIQSIDLSTFLHNGGDGNWMSVKTIQARINELNDMQSQVDDWSQQSHYEYAANELKKLLPPAPKDLKK